MGQDWIGRRIKKAPYQKDKMRAKRFGWIGIFCLALLQGCAAQPTVKNTVTIAAPTHLPKVAPVPSPTPHSDDVTVTGWLTTVWNGDAHYSITTEDGKTFKLQLDEELTKPLGGPLAVDRQKVTITGKIINENPPTILVKSIQFAK